MLIRTKAVIIVLAIVALASVCVADAKTSSQKVAKVETWYTCRICRADKYEKTQGKRVIVSQVTLTTLSKYYLKSVDPAHKHDWWTTAIHTPHPQPGAPNAVLIGDLPHPPGRTLDDTAMITILKSLPDASARKSVVAVMVTDYHDKRYEKVQQSLLKLRKAYIKNPKQNDWPQLLRNYGLYPSDPKK